jgi:hypothetical protein
MRPRNFPFEQHIFHLGPRPATTSLRVNSAFEDPAKIWAAKPPKRPTHREVRASIASIQPQEMHAMSVASPLGGRHVSHELHILIPNAVS